MLIFVHRSSMVNLVFSVLETLLASINEEQKKQFYVTTAIGVIQTIVAIITLIVALLK
jgi:hypothetical protein